MSEPLKSIVVAEDDPAILLVLQRWVSASSYKIVGEARDGHSAAELVRKHRPHLILLDFHMPALDGLEAAKQIVALGTTAVVMMTGDADPEVARRAMDLGASGYILKPFELAQLSAILETAWHRFQTVQALQGELRSLNEALETRKLLEKAKGILMQQQGFSEEEAHRTLQQMSQQQGISLKEVCRSVIQVKMLLGKSPGRKVA